MNKVYVIFGAGKAGKDLLKIFPKKVSYFVDNDPNKWGICCEGVPICPPERLLKEEQNTLRIFIASMFFDQIQIQLEKMGFIGLKHYWNIIPYHSLLNKMSFLDLVEQQAESLINNQQANNNLFNRLHTIFKIQDELVNSYEEKRLLLVIDPEASLDYWVVRIINDLMNFFKLQVYLHMEEIPITADDLLNSVEKFKRLGYSKMLYLGKDATGIEILRKYFTCVCSADVELKSDERKQWLDSMYEIVNELGFGYKKLSVIVPNYNYEEYLVKRLRSIFGQQYPIYEIVILDDASTDESVKITDYVLEEYNGLKQLIVNDKNSGSVFKQWKKGIEAAQGDYFWIAEVDDYASPIMISNLIKPFEQDKEVVISFCDSMLVDGSGQWQGFTSDTYVQDTKFFANVDCFQDIFDGKEFIEENLVHGNTIPNVSAVIFKRNSIIPEYLEKLEKFSRCGDWYFYILILSEGKIAYHIMPMNFFVRHPKSITINSEITELAMERDIINEAIKAVFTKGKLYKK